jgi:hypothetical protein
MIGARASTVDRMCTTTALVFLTATVTSVFWLKWFGWLL